MGEQRAVLLHFYLSPTKPSLPNSTSRLVARRLITMNECVLRIYQIRGSSFSYEARIFPPFTLLVSTAILLLSLLSGEQPSADNALSSDSILAKADVSADQYSGMAWLTEQCPGNRTAKQKEELKACVQWSTGLEHETFLVHSREDYKEEYVVNVGSVVNQMSRYGRAFGLDRETHTVAVYLERTGEWVVSCNRVYRTTIGNRNEVDSACISYVVSLSVGTLLLLCSHSKREFGQAK